MRALVWFLEAVIEAAVDLAIFFVLAVVWIAEQAWKAFMSGLDGTPWARAWRHGDKTTNDGFEVLDAARQGWSGRARR